MQQPFTLNALGGGQSAVITAVHGTGEMHARLRDLGFTEESRVTCLFSSAFGDPRAYRVKDTVIALRGDDARCVCCERDEDGALVCRRAECGRCDGRELIIDGKEEYRRPRIWRMSRPVRRLHEARKEPMAPDAEAQSAPRGGFGPTRRRKDCGTSGRTPYGAPIAGAWKPKKPKNPGQPPEVSHERAARGAVR